MEFLAGIIFTLVVGFIARKVWQVNERRKVRAAYIPPRPVKDYDDRPVR